MASWLCCGMVAIGCGADQPSSDCTELEGTFTFSAAASSCDGPRKCEVSVDCRVACSDGERTTVSGDAKSFSWRTAQARCTGGLDDEQAEGQCINADGTCRWAASFQAGVTRDVGSAASCSDVGSCGAARDECACETSCLWVAPDRHLCGFFCENDAECAAKKNPVTGARFTKCVPRLYTPGRTYASYCM